jgi:hypothetical protein
MTRYMYDIPLGDSLQRKLLEDIHESYSLGPLRENTRTEHYDDEIRKKKIKKVE